jgi:hypothetical protein
VTDPGTPDPEDLPIRIRAQRIRTVTPHRAVVWWRTSEPGTSTVIDASTGRTYEHDGYKTIHRVVVHGRVGDIKALNIVSEATDGSVASKNIMVHFNARGN